MNTTAALELREKKSVSLTSPGSATPPRWVENVTALIQHLPFSSTKHTASWEMSRCILHLLVHDARGLPHFLSRVDSVTGLAHSHATERLYRADGRDGTLTYIAEYPLLESGILGMSVPVGPRTGFAQALDVSHDVLIQDFSIAGLHAYIISGPDLTFGVVHQRGGPPRLLASDRYWSQFQKTIRETGLWIPLLGDDAEQAGSLGEREAWDTMEIEDDEATLGLQPEFTDQFDPELLVHEMPMQAHTSLLDLAQKLRMDTLAWQRLPASQRAAYNSLRLHYIAIPVVLGRHHVTNDPSAFACLADLIGTACRLYGGNLSLAGSISGLLERTLDYLTDYDVPSGSHRDMKGITHLTSTIRRLLDGGSLGRQADRAEDEALRIFLTRLARVALEGDLGRMSSLL